MKLYTRKGDAGDTSTLSGRRLQKDSCLIQVNGEIDELQTQIDKVVSYLKMTYAFPKAKLQLARIQMLLWQLGGEISYGIESSLVKYPITERDIIDLETWIDDCRLKLVKFQRFNNILSIEANEARVRTRRLERTLTDFLRTEGIRDVSYKYINRLSDYFFAVAVKVEHLSKLQEGRKRAER